MKFTTTVLALCVSVASAQTIADIVVGSPDHTTLTQAVTAADPFILGLLSDPMQDFTLFAPDDAAFASLVGAVGEDYVADLLTPEWTEHLSCLLLSHAVAGSVPSSAITGPLNVTSASEYTLFVNNVEGVITVDGNTVTIPDIMADNGIVHSISGLPILPPCVSESIAAKGAANAEFSTLVSLVIQAGLLDTLDTMRPLTLLAPTNAAFDAVPSDILEYLASNVTALTEVLTYHVLSGINFLDDGDFETLNGDTLTIENDMVNENSEIIGDEDLASNGVVFVISGVLLPPSLVLPDFSTMAPVTMSPVTMSPVTMAPATVAPVTPTAPLPTIAGIVVASEAHTTLEAAVLAAPEEVLMALSNPDSSLTLFAPDDAAFAALVGVVGQEFFDQLLTPQWGFHLSCVLFSHALGEAVPSSAITGPMEVPSISGWVLKADNMDGSITIDGNNVTVPDIMASNGIVHSISGLPILPDCVTKSIADLGSASTDLSTLMSLVKAAELGDALNTMSPLTLFAPTNAAFDKVAPEVIAYLGGNVTALTEVLMYHVVTGNLVFGDRGTFPTSGDGEYATLNGDTVIISNGTVNDGDLPENPVYASNGVIHVVDSVLIPSTLYLPEFTDAPSGAPTSGAATTGVGLMVGALFLLSIAF